MNDALEYDKTEITLKGNSTYASEDRLGEDAQKKGEGIKT